MFDLCLWYDGCEHIENYGTDVVFLVVHGDLLCHNDHAKITNKKFGRPVVQI